MKVWRCNTCLFSRPIISENGVHRSCTLSRKESMKCISGAEDKYVSLYFEDMGLTNVKLDTTED